MKKSTRLFFRSFFLSSVITGCLLFGIFGTVQAYKNTRQIGFGDDRKAVLIEWGKIRFLDWEWEF